MRTITFAAIFALLAVTSTAVVYAAKPSRRSVASSAARRPSPTDRLVQEALSAEAAGDVTRRGELLEQAVKADPQYAQAHWHRGEILVDGRWSTIEEATKRATADGKTFEYNSRRNAAANTAAGQLSLAAWCREHGHREQHRAHALLALNLKPNPTELQMIRQELDLHPAKDLWLTTEELTAQQESSESAIRDMKVWFPRLKEWLSTLQKRDRSREQFLEVRDVAAIPAIERTFSIKSQESARMAIEVLSNIEEHAATESLIKHAVLSEWDDVRFQAAMALRPRSLYSYAPLLLAGLEAPLEVEFNFSDASPINHIGSWRYSCRLFREGPTANSQWDIHSVLQIETIVDDNRPYGDVNGPLSLHLAPSERGDQQLAQQMSWNVELANERGRQLNSRIGRALFVATGEVRAAAQAAPQTTNQPAPALMAEPLIGEPREWWKWWYDHNEIYYPSQRPTEQFYSYAPRVEYRVYTKSSCFIAGTPVWTPTGKTGIDRVRPGDLVLAKHPETGELAYKAVIATTTRPASPTVEIDAGGHTLTATRGHPLWVSGQGWKMAKELSVGDQLHTATGPLPITAIRSGLQAPAFNLVVDGFNTYCVGPDKVLVHDNNLRRPTDVVVPGLISQR